MSLTKFRLRVTPGVWLKTETWPLVMDLHKGLNRIQQQLAEQSLDGASVYGLSEADPVVLRKNSSRYGFQLVVMMQAAETRAGNDAMSGW
jgi:hypothetical protein